MAGFSWQGVKKWVEGTASSFSRKSGLSGFLADPAGAVSDYLTDKAVDYVKGKATSAIMGGRQVVGGMSSQFNPQIDYVSAGQARSGVPSYGKFTSGQANIPGMKVQRVRNAYDNLYNSPHLKSPNIELTIAYTRPNIPGSSGTIALGSAKVSRQKISGVSTKSALSRVS